MNSDQSESDLISSKAFMDLRDQYLERVMVDVRSGKKQPIFVKKISTPLVEVRKLDYTKSLSQGHGQLIFRYFTFESLLLLVCLTASLLILPLVLPPLPPPPFLLLLLPICILALLMILAFMPSSTREATYTYV